MKKKLGRMGMDSPLLLEDAFGSAGDLVEIKSGTKYRCEVRKILKCNLEAWMKTPGFDEIRSQFLDLAVVARVNEKRIKRQDVDNIAKIVLDALKETEGDPRFLFRDDSQIVRLLVWKIRKTDSPDYETDSIAISFRKHDPDKQMILVRQKEM
jgi:Holliday junction resolvase RusA-like endonuclease